MSLLDHAGPWHFDDLVGIPDDGRRYEVVDGAPVVTPPLSQFHQRLGVVLLRQLAEQCPAQWWVAYAFPVPMGTDGRVPDLTVVSGDASIRPDGARTRPGRSTWGWWSRSSARRAARPTASPHRGSTPRPGPVVLAGGDRAAPGGAGVPAGGRGVRAGRRGQRQGVVPVPWGQATIELTALLPS